MVYLLRKDKNDLIFNHHSALGSTLLPQTMAHALFIHKEFQRSPFFTIHFSRQDANIVWHKPPPSSYKVNTDGSYSNTLNTTPCGRLVRDSNGRVLKSFHVNLGNCNALMAEHRALSMVLHLPNSSISILSTLRWIPWWLLIS